MQNKTKKFIINTIVIIVAVISLTIVTVSSTSVFAAKKELLSNIDAQQTLRDLSRVELVTAAFKKCVPKYVTRRDNNRLSVFDSNIVDVGPWLEKHILGSDAGGDGAIKCDEKNDAIIDAFANEVGVNHNGILCNKNDNFNSPGLIAWLVPEGATPTGVNIGISDASRKQYPNGCSVFGVNGTKGAEGGYFDKEKVEVSNGSSSPTFYFNPQGGAQTLGAEYVDGNDYVREVYAEWRRNNKNLNKYLRTYGETNSDDISDYAYYYMDKQDYFVQCGNIKSTKEQGGQPITVMSNNGVVTTEYYLIQNQTAKRGKLDGNKTDCATIAAQINDLDKDKWRTKMAEIYEDECNNNQDVKDAWNLERRKADYIIKTFNGDPNKAVVITPEYEATPDTLIWYSDSNPAGYDKTKYDNWEKNGLVWKNYSESTDGGDTVYTITELTEEDKTDANTVLEQYNEYKNEGFFKDKGEKEGFICRVPEGYEYAEAESSDQDSSDDGDPCYDAGIEGMSWVLCPTINNTKNTVDGMEWALGLMLSIESNKLFGDNNVTYRVWETFRNIANVVLIIIFLAIIFSQLTGYGIDNYGIKKMLPKLIIMAVLINLSYILCELAVDLSNILGVGLNNLFESIAKGAGNTDTPLGDIVTAILTAAASTAAASGVVITVASLASGGDSVMLIIVLVLALLGALVAIFMFLVMVGARMIIVVVFTAISPVALALYILPNTQSLFKKWWKVFEAALVVYPICGALYGAHFIIKAITVGQGGEVNFFMAIAALIAPFLPFFALPSLLKGALAGLGAAAGAITAAGAGLKKSLAKGDNAVRSSERFKNAQQEGHLNRLIRRVGMDEKTGNLTKKGLARYEKAQGKGGSSARLMNARIAAVRKGLDQRREGATAYANAMAAAGIAAADDITESLFGIANSDDVIFGKGKIGAYYGGQMITAAKDGNTEAIDAAVAAAKAGGMKEKDIAKVLRHIFKTDSEGKSMLNLGENERAAYGRKLASQNGSIVAKDLELKHHLQTGSEIAHAGDLATQGNYFENAIKNKRVSVGDYNEDDWIGADMGSIAAGITSGLLSQNMAQRIQAKNPNLDPEKLVAIGLAADNKVGNATTQELIDGAKKLVNNKEGGSFAGLSYNDETVQGYIRNKPQEVTIAPQSTPPAPTS